MGPISGILSDRYGHRPFVIVGLLMSALGFFIMTRIGTSISFFTTLAPLLLIGGGMGLFASPNRASIMNSVPGPRRGVASGISTTLVNVGNTVSIGLAFIIMSSNTPRSILDSIFSGLPVKDNTFSINSFVYSLHLVFYASMTMLLVSVLFYTFGLSPRKKRKKRDENEKRGDPD
jgi:MFS family permease